jgi:glucose/mannose transport system permease protein
VAAQIALLPTILVMALCFYGAIAWTVVISFTDSELVPSYNFVGARQYAALFGNDRWAIAYHNLAIFGFLFIASCLTIGLVLAVLIDQQVRAENLFRTVFLYPLSLSFVVTGLAWQWLLNPTTGVQSFMRGIGFTDFQFDWIVDRNRALYAIVIAAVWHMSGLIMAIMLAGLRGIDADIWRATRVDGVHPVKVYWHIIIPMLRPLVLTSVVLLAEAAIKSYDIVVAMTGGGPGNATDVPGKFIMDYMFKRGDLGIASAGSVVLLGSAVAALAPYLYLELARRSR